MDSTKKASSQATAGKSTTTVVAKQHTNKKDASKLSRIARSLVLGGLAIGITVIIAYGHPEIQAIFCSLAAIKFGLLVLLPEGQIRSGKSGTVVWQKNGRMRVNAFPTLVRNTFTTAVRAILSNFSGSWAALTQSQQNGWLNAEGWTTTNRVGQTKPLKGKTLFTTVNTNLDTIGVAPVALVPDRISVPAPVFSAAPTIDVSSTAITLALTNADISLGISVEATNILSNGSNSPGRNKFRTIYSVDDSSAIVAVDIWAAYSARFVAPVAGEIIFLRCKYIGAVNGQMGATSQVFKIVVQA